MNTADVSLIEIYLSDSKVVTPNLKDLGSIDKAVSLMTSWNNKGFLFCMISSKLRTSDFFCFDFEFLIFFLDLNLERFSFI